MADHYRDAKHWLKQAEEHYERLDYPHQKATVAAMLAIAHAVLEVDSDVGLLKDAVTPLEDAVKYH